MSIELKSWEGDKIHIDSDVGLLDGNNKTWNFVVTEREPGKTTLMWKKIYNAFKRERRPSVVFRRYQTDITSTYIDDTEKLINNFTRGNIELEYTKADLKSGGMMNVYIKGIDEVFFRFIALNAPLERLKSMYLPKVKYFMFDEFICNRRLGEKYLIDEPFRVKELYTTYNRENKKRGFSPIKCYLFGNPYSLFNPFFSDFKVDVNKLFPGALVVKNDYCVWCYQTRPELKAFILSSNPLYQFDDEYRKYAFDGRAMQDADIRVETTQPLNFKLQYVLKIHGKCLGVYRGFRLEPEKTFFWIAKMDPGTIGKRRDIVCFDFGDMADRTVLLRNDGKRRYSLLKEAIAHRWVTFKSVEESWLLEEIYQEI